MVGHLEELRTRLLRAAVYGAVFSAVCWAFYPSLFALLANPVSAAMETAGARFLVTGVTEGFSIKLQISVIFGLIAASPLILAEGWAFVAPALHPAERKWILLTAPFSAALFFAGVVSAYFILPVGIEWLIAQNPPGASFMPSLAETLLFVAKMELAFGLIFQMPVILVLLANFGLIRAATLKKFWRHAIVAICIVVAVLTPTTDAFTMALMSLPMAVLYAGTIQIISFLEKRRERKRSLLAESS